MSPAFTSRTRQFARVAARRARDDVDIAGLVTKRVRGASFGDGRSIHGYAVDDARQGAALRPCTGCDEEVVAVADVKRLPAAVVEYWDWQRHAACRGMDQDVFFHPEGERDPSRSERIDRARQVCRHCPVAQLCREWAHRVEEPFGVWGGESEDERRAVLAARRRERRRAGGARPAA